MRKRDDPDVVTVAAKPRSQGEDVLLRPAVGAGGHDLHDPNTPAGEWPAFVLLEAGLSVAVKTVGAAVRSFGAHR
jgi:hypothetical protein